MGVRMLRELATVPEVVRAVPAPPLPELASPLTIRHADPNSDAALISQWMNRPHLARTWGYDYSETEWREHLRLQLAGTYSRPLLVYRDGQAFAYVEIFRAAKDVIATVYDADPHDIGFHGAIADPTDLDRGMAREIAPRIFASVFAIEPQCRRVVFDAETANERALLVMQRWGCVFLGNHTIAGARHTALYALPRPPHVAGHPAS